MVRMFPTSEVTLFLITLAACTGASSSGAPFSLDQPTAVRWAVHENSDEQTGVAVLAMATDAYGCDAFATDLDEGFGASGKGGDAVFFVLSYMYWGDKEASEAPWNGLWVAGAESQNEGVYRELNLVISDGNVAWVMEQDSGAEASWLDLAQVDDGVEGPYFTRFWEGSAVADGCPAFASENLGPRNDDGEDLEDSG